MVCQIHRYFFVIMRLASALLAITFVMQFAGCGYHFSNSSQIPIAPGQSIWVSFIRNESTSSIAQTVLRRAILEESHQLRGLFPAVSETDADFQVSGALRTYSTKAVSFTAADQAKDYRLIIDGEFEIRRKGDKAPVWKGILQSYQDFPAAENLALQQNAEEAALAAAARIMAHKLFLFAEQAY